MARDIRNKARRVCSVAFDPDTFDRMHRLVQARQLVSAVNGKAKVSTLTSIIHEALEAYLSLYEDEIRLFDDVAKEVRKIQGKKEKER